jgi:hypothetical protein
MKADHQPSGELETIPGVMRIKHQEQKEFDEFVVDAKEDIREDVFNCIARNGWTLRELSREHLSLEDIFAKITEEDQPEAKPAKKKKQDKQDKKEEKKQP